MMAPIVYMAAAFFGALFIQSSIHKAARFAKFTQILRGYGLTPSAADKPLAATLIAAELLAAVLLVASPWAGPLGFAAAALLFVLYGGAVGINLARGRTDIDCGCDWFSAGSGSGRLTLWHMVRPLALGFLACGAGLAAIGAPATGGPATFMLGIVGAAPLIVVYGAMATLLENWSNMKARRL